MKGKTKRILVVLVKWRHHANGLLPMTTQKYENLFLPDCKKCRFLLRGLYCTWKGVWLRMHGKEVEEWNSCLKLWLFSFLKESVKSCLLWYHTTLVAHFYFVLLLRSRVSLFKTWRYRITFSKKWWTLETQCSLDFWLQNDWGTCILPCVSSCSNFLPVHLAFPFLQPSG